MLNVNNNLTDFTVKLKRIYNFMLCKNLSNLTQSKLKRYFYNMYQNIKKLVKKIIVFN